MIEQVQMKSVSDLKFPVIFWILFFIISLIQLTFSPLATSSPKFTKMRPPKQDISFDSSTESNSSGNITSQAIAGVDESHV